MTPSAPRSRHGPTRSRRSRNLITGRDAGAPPPFSDHLLGVSSSYQNSFNISFGRFVSIQVPALPIIDDSASFSCGPLLRSRIPPGNSNRSWHRRRRRTSRGSVGWCHHLTPRRRKGGTGGKRRHGDGHLRGGLRGIPRFVPRVRTARCEGRREEEHQQKGEQDDPVHIIQYPYQPDNTTDATRRAPAAKKKRKKGDVALIHQRSFYGLLRAYFSVRLPVSV